MYYMSPRTPVFPAQWMFLGFYLCLTALVLRVYYVAGRRRIPPWVVLLLLLTKRVRSIFMLRLFNDGIATMIMYICVLMVLKRKVRCGVASCVWMLCLAGSWTW